MLSQQIRRNFLKFFQEKGHTVCPSSPVIPHDDPTLLFTNAGMNQFKDAFLGRSERDYVRAATSQKCVRVGGKHNDLDNVGHTSRHLTFFEMLGNFSFGDYFKKEAIAFAWEVSTQVFQFDPAFIWVSIFEDDDEAFELWSKIVPEKKIVRLGEKDNFWAMGDTGPCGPCSELYYDRGEAYGSAPSMKEDVAGERFLEFWNLVFMQFNKDASGKLHPLPKPSIDTGSGLERVVSLKMGVDHVFATDILRGLIDSIEEISGKKYDPQNGDTAPAFHVIADHLRTLAFAVSDGAKPSNIERGYVLRKLLRRAVRYGRIIGLHEPFLAKLLPRLGALMGDDYTQLRESEALARTIFTEEEEAFLRTLKRGGNLLNHVIEKAKESPLQEISGEAAFKLKDTYGLPLEEVLLIAKDAHLQVNLEAYALLEERAKEVSKGAHITHKQEVSSELYRTLLEKHGETLFTGYSETKTESSVQAIIKEGALATTLQAGEEGLILLKTTPFYAEKGGQVGDSGTISTQEALFTVKETKAPQPGLILHHGKMERGSLSVGEIATASLDTKRRALIQNNHTATHLLHFALQTVLGPHIKQAGSLVDEERLRFDFNHTKPLTATEIEAIEELVNEKIREDAPVSSYELSYEEAQKKPQIKQFFGDKYGSKVRVVDIDYSKELCGGTHTLRTGTIGYFRLLKEGSIASGVRRIEAVTGKAADLLTREREGGLQNKIHDLEAEIKKLSSEIKEGRKRELRHAAKELITQASEGALIAEVKLPSSELAPLSDALFELNPHLFLFLATGAEGKCHLFCRVGQELVKKGVQAVNIIKEVAPLVQGSGGGKAEMAQAGGKDSSGIPKALESASALIRKLAPPTSG